MALNFLLRAVIAAAVLLPVPAWSAGQDVPSAEATARATAQAAQAARVLMQRGRFADALAILRPLTRSRSVDANVLFQIGLAAIGASQDTGVSEAERDALLDEAIAALRKMLVRRPELVRVRLELARAFFLKGEDSLAKRHFEQVLAGKPPAGVTLNVSRFLAEIRARKRWSVRVGVALAPDTNIGAGSDERTIYIFGLPFRRNEEELTTSGIGVSAWVGGEYQFPLADRWRLRTGGEFSRREYKASRFDQMTVSGHAGPRWLIGRGSEASLLLTALHHWTGSGLEEPSHHDVGLRVEGRHRLTRRTTLSAQVSRHERRYDKRKHLEGPVTDVFVGTGWVASPTVRVDAGIGWGRERPETERERRTRRQVRLGVTAALPWGFTVGGSGTLRWTDYEGNWFPFTEGGSARRDITRSLRLSAHNRAFTLEGFSPQLSLVREDRKSNAQLHDYERTSGELRFVRLF